MNRSASKERGFQRALRTHCSWAATAGGNRIRTTPRFPGGNAPTRRKRRRWRAASSPVGNRHRRLAHTSRCRESRDPRHGQSHSRRQLLNRATARQPIASTNSSRLDGSGTAAAALLAPVKLIIAVVRSTVSVSPLPRTGREFAKQLPIETGVQPQTLGDGQDDLSMRDRKTDFFGNMDGAQQGPLLVAGGACTPLLAREGDNRNPADLHTCSSSPA